MFCVYVHFFDMETKKNEIKKRLGRPGFKPSIYVSEAILTNNTTTVESTTSLCYHRISSQLYQDVYFRNCSNIAIADNPPRKTIYSVLIL